VYTTRPSRGKNVLNFTMNAISADEAHLRALVKFTGLSFRTPRPVPFGALIVDSQSGETLIRARNAVAAENDPSSHAELRAVRLACKKRKSLSLRGYTLYSTCEPCAMCMANALWAGLDRVVYGATVEDANRYCRQIHIPAAEVARRSDMQCEVVGPFLRELCNTLFDDPRMQATFATWHSRKETA
jgi:tRNA(Arg) A34 adenosine deaminase TadA